MKDFSLKAAIMLSTIAEIEDYELRQKLYKNLDDLTIEHYEAVKGELGRQSDHLDKLLNNPRSN